MSFLLGLILGLAGAGYLAYLYRAEINDWMDRLGD
jgi:hypothetical protein